MSEFYLDDARWALIASSLPGKAGDPGRRGRDNRLFMEAVFYVVRTRSPWRRLPPEFGHWYTAYARFKRWTLMNVWPMVFAKLAEDPTCEYFYDDGAIFFAPERERRVCLPRLRAFCERAAPAAPIGHFWDARVRRVLDAPPPKPAKGRAIDLAEPMLSGFAPLGVDEKTDSDPPIAFGKARALKP